MTWLYLYVVLPQPVASRIWKGTDSLSQLRFLLEVFIGFRSPGHAVRLCACRPCTAHALPDHFSVYFNAPGHPWHVPSGSLHHTDLDSLPAIHVETQERIVYPVEGSLKTWRIENAIAPPHVESVIGSHWGAFK